MIAGTTNTMLMYALGASVGGSQPAASPFPAAVLGSSVASANGPAPATTNRMQQLLSGAAPIDDAERRLLQRVEGVLRGTVETVNRLVAEGARQARLGRDIHGRPLQGAEDHPYEQRVLDLVNVERTRRGLQPLRYHRQLDAASERHNQQQVAMRRMAHDGIGDGDPGSRILATGFNRSWGENVATGQLSPEQVVAEWMASPGHRRNILDPSFRHMGVSYATAADGRSYWAQSFGA